MRNNQTKCHIIYKITAMRGGDDEEMINYEWPWFVLVISIKILLIMVQPILYLSEF